MQYYNKLAQLVKEDRIKNGTSFNVQFKKHIEEEIGKRRSNAKRRKDEKQQWIEPINDLHLLPCQSDSEEDNGVQVVNGSGYDSQSDEEDKQEEEVEMMKGEPTEYKVQFDYDEDDSWGMQLFGMVWYVIWISISVLLTSFYGYPYDGIQKYEWSQWCIPKSTLVVLK